MENIYYILTLSQLSKVKNKDIVENENTLRYNLNNNKCVCKTKKGVKNPKFMDGIKKYTHSEILLKMKEEEWQKNDL